MTSMYYVPSGQVAPRAVPVVLGLALAILPSAWLYAFLLRLLPGVLCPFATLGYAAWLGFLVKSMAKQGRIRNAVWIGWIGFASGLLGWYLHWAAWSALVLHTGGEGGTSLPGTFLGMAGHPAALGEFAIDLVQQGSIAGWHMSAALVMAIWLLELVCLVQVPRSSGLLQVAEPFCETAGTWAEKIDVKRHFAFLADAGGAALTLARDPAALHWLLRPVADDDEGSHAEVTLYRCAASDSYLSVSNVAIGRSEKGAVERKITLVIHLLPLPGIDADALLRQWSQPAGPQADGAAPPELADAIAHLQSDRFDAAHAAALPSTAAADAGLRADAHRLCALASSRLGRWQDALQHWQALYADEPTVHNALQLASTSVMAGDLAGGIAWLEKAEGMNAVLHDMPGVGMLTNFVTALAQAGRTAAAMPYLERIRAAYTELGITDATFLRMRGVPFFSAFLDNSYPIVQAELAPEAGRAWYASMAPHLDADGQAGLSAWLDSRFGEVAA